MNKFHTFLHKYFEGSPSLWKWLLLWGVGIIIYTLFVCVIPFIDSNFLGGIVREVFEATINFVKYLAMSFLIGFVTFAAIFLYYIGGKKKK